MSTANRTRGYHKPRISPIRDDRYRHNGDRWVCESSLRGAKGRYVRSGFGRSPGAAYLKWLDAHHSYESDR